MTVERVPERTQWIRPTAGDDRIGVLDALRGFALFGVVVVNMSVDTVWSDDVVARTATVADDVFAFGLKTLAAGRFLTIFTFLFGLGVFMQISRCDTRGVPHLPLLARRLVVLLAIGLMHYLLVGWTDILHVYAVLGFVLLAAHRLSTNAILTAAILIMVLNVGEPRPLVVMAGARVIHVTQSASTTADFTSSAPDTPLFATTPDDRDDEVARLTRIYVHGTYADIVRESLRDFIDYVRFFAPRWWFGSLLPIMLLGAYVARRQVVEHVEAHIELLRLVFRWGLALGLAGTTMELVHAVMWPDSESPFVVRQIAAAGEYIGIRALGLAYASGFVLAARNVPAGWLLSGLTAVGRSAFTNYLLQTAVAVALFYGVGLGLYGRVNPVLGALIATVTFAVQMVGSTWWLSRFRYGPAEWVWRSCSYGRLQPMRRRP